MLDILSYLESNDFIVNDVETGTATPIIRTKTIPYSNKILDFSKVTGMYNYNQREGYIKVTYGNKYRKEFYNRISLAMTKLLEEGTIKVKRTEEKGYYVGTITGYSEIKDLVTVGEFEIYLRLEPFKYANEAYGDVVWDTFCFETDYLTDNSLSITDNLSTTIFNNGVGTDCILNVDTDMSVTVTDANYKIEKYTLTKGDNTIRISNGENELIFSGTGNVTINFREKFL